MHYWLCIYDCSYVSEQDNSAAVAAGGRVLQRTVARTAAIGVEHCIAEGRIPYPNLPCTDDIVENGPCISFHINRLRTAS